MNTMQATTDAFTSALHWLRQKAAPGAKLRSDSRMVQAGDIFFALPGSQTGADRHVDDALERGAGAVLLSVQDRSWPGAFTRFDHSDPRVYRFEQLEAVAGKLAASYLGRPSSKLPVVAVTGTNGKTSVSHWIAQAWPDKAAVIGTLGAGVLDADSGSNHANDALEGFGLTTPDAVRLQQMLQDFLDQGARLVAMEASSIGLAQGRLQGLEPAVAVFTNLSRDHLDYHADMQHYAAAKAGLFSMLHASAGAPQAVINADDAWSQVMIDACPENCSLWFYSLEGEPEAARSLAGRFGAPLLCATYQPLEHESLLQWALFEAGASKATAQGQLRLGLMGSFNAANALAVAASLMALGQSADQAMASLPGLKPVPGRMQCFGDSSTPLLVVDYAHTPDAIALVLNALSMVARQRQGRLQCLLGAGGGRDAGKRPAMGAAAMSAADRLCLTSDNPRDEDPRLICEALQQGALSVCPDAAGDDSRLCIELDRGRAIDRLIREAHSEDVILVAGKGHERYQEVRGQRLAFDDRDHVARGLRTHWGQGAKS